jgi:SAM-dependent methyltransferase
MLKHLIPTACHPYLKRHKFQFIRTKYKLRGDRKQSTGIQVGIEEELEFWRTSLVAGRFADRLGSRELDRELARLIERGSGVAPEDAMVLDVGSGPVTTLGNQWNGKTIRLFATDTLATEYCEMLAELGIEPAVTPTTVVAEQLETAFDPDSFDLVYCTNALDHCRDPLAALDSMLKVAKPGCCIYIWSYENEGARERYHGMHQWDLYERRGDFRIAGAFRDESIRKRLKEKAEVTCRWSPDAGGFIVAEIWKHRV